MLRIYLYKICILKKLAKLKFFWLIFTWSYCWQLILALLQKRRHILCRFSDGMSPKGTKQIWGWLNSFVLFQIFAQGPLISNRLDCIMVRQFWWRENGRSSIWNSITNIHFRSTCRFHVCPRWRQSVIYTWNQFVNLLNLF